ncbi:hypothetical protein [Miltoncostaea marina]|uniref:hypothetical protein n=1 Tax=Miltoncostaea marina TaxID=2843215 RepID=UPI001C3C7C71|nr:hypothetical protein [Miltoncostaea marina]
MPSRAPAVAGVALALLVPQAAEAAWSGGAPLSARDGAGYADAEAATEAGQAVVAWIRTPRGGAPRAARVQVASRAGRDWTRPVTVSGAARAPRGRPSTRAATPWWPGWWAAR